MIFSRIFATSTPLFKSFGMFVVFFFCLNIQQVFVRAGPRIVIQQNNHPDTENEISHRIPSAAPSMKTSSMLRHSTPAWRDIQNSKAYPLYANCDLLIYSLNFNAIIVILCCVG